MVFYSLACQENVKQFKPRIFQDFLGHLYHIDVEKIDNSPSGLLTTVEDAKAYGFPATRTRQFVVMRHKLKTIATRLRVTQFTKLFYRTMHQDLDWRCFFVADEDDLQAELDFYACRAGRCQQANTRNFYLHADAFENALTSYEQKALTRLRGEKPGRAWLLNQSEGRQCWSGEKALQTIIRNVHLLWADGKWHVPRTGAIIEGRWLTGRELLLVQGYHTYKNMSAFQCSSFCKGNPQRKINVVKEQAGDTMNLNVMGVMVLYCQLCVKKSASNVKVGQLQAIRRGGLVDLVDAQGEDLD